MSRYQAICQRHPPELSEAEWDVLRDALNGVWMRDDISVAPVMLAAEVEDADRDQGLGEEWGIDAGALAKRITGMSYAEGVAIAEAVEVWWATQA